MLKVVRRHHNKENKLFSDCITQILGQGMCSTKWSLSIIIVYFLVLTLFFRLLFSKYVFKFSLSDYNVIVSIKFTLFVFNTYSVLNEVTSSQYKSLLIKELIRQSKIIWFKSSQSPHSHKG